MALNVAGRYSFNGPFTQLADLAETSGVYLITIIENGIHKVIDVGESNEIRSRITNHDRKDQWVHYAGNKTVHASTYHCDQPMRLAIESELRLLFNPVCGIR